MKKISSQSGNVAGGLLPHLLAATVFGGAAVIQCGVMRLAQVEQCNEDLVAMSDKIFSDTVNETDLIQLEVVCGREKTEQIRASLSKVLPVHP